jgi:hypothetical protein
MQRFVARHNVQHFREMLATETDPQQRQMLEKLLAEELAKLAAEASDPAESSPSSEPEGPHADGPTPS